MPPSNINAVILCLLVTTMLFYCNNGRLKCYKWNPGMHKYLWTGSKCIAQTERWYFNNCSHWMNKLFSSNLEAPQQIRFVSRTRPLDTTMLWHYNQGSRLQPITITVALGLCINNVYSPLGQRFMINWITGLTILILPLPKKNKNWHFRFFLFPPTMEVKYLTMQCQHYLCLHK